MAQIDTSIYSNFQQPKINTPFENEAMQQQIMQGRNQNRLSQMKFAEDERAGVERNMLAEAYRGSYSQDGTQDRNKLYGSVAAGGGGHLIPGMQKGFNESDSSGVDLNNKRLSGQKQQAEITQAQKERSAAILGALINDPNLSFETVMQSLRESVASGDADEQQAQAMAQRVPKNPAQIKPFLTQLLDSVRTPQQQYESNNPKPDHNRPFNSSGAPNKAYQDYEIRKAQAGAVQNFGAPVAATDRAGNPVFIQPGNRGGVNVLPYSPPPKEVKPFTESENNSAGFLGRMQAAEKTLAGLQGGESTEKTAMAGAIPFIGDYAQRKAMNPMQQQYKQAADDWIRAKLRKESGAVIGIDESAAEYRTYFPQPGDELAVIKQKAQSRMQAEAQLKQSSGRAADSLQKASVVDNTAKPTAPAKPGGGVKFLGFE